MLGNCGVKIRSGPTGWPRRHTKQFRPCRRRTSLETIDTLKLGLEWIFPYTSTHWLSFTLFLFEAEGVLKEPDSLEALLSAALDGAHARIEELTNRGIDGLADQRAPRVPNRPSSRQDLSSRAEGRAKPDHPKPTRSKPNRAKKEAKRKRPKI